MRWRDTACRIAENGDVVREETEMERKGREKS
jgi:hypothetical protein